MLGMLCGCLPAYPKPEAQTGSLAFESQVDTPLLNANDEEGIKRAKTLKLKNGKEVKVKSKKKKKNKIKNADVFKARPLAKLGFGITAYIDILWFMVLAFGAFTLMLIPTMTFFHTGTETSVD